jgi:hypothetical protein
MRSTLEHLASFNMRVFETIITSAITSGILTSVLVWLTKTWISERLKQSIQHEYGVILEAHKSTLKANADLALAQTQARLASENAISLERHKAELQLATAERQVRLKHLFDRESETIAEVYANLTEFRSAVSAYLAVFETPEMGSRADRRKTVNDTFKKVSEHFRANRLYMERGLADSVASFIRDLSHKAIDFNTLVDLTERLDREAQQTWNRLDKFMTQEEKPLFDALEEAFRRRLGDHQ